MGAAVLLVDDERFARTLYSDYLSVAGYDVQVAETADAALEALRQRRFELLITDIVLPGADGLELLAEAKRLDPNMEALVITALDRVDPAVRAMKSGASDYLVKPVTPEALQLAVQKCLSARALLAENKALRSHIQLFDTCQRITSSLDHDRAVALALSALAQELGAKGALFLERAREDELVLAGQFGVDEASARALASATASGVARSSVAAADLPLPAGAPTASALVLRVAEGEALLGAMLALVAGKPDPQQVASAEFVCSHLALALRTLGHLRQVEHLAYLDDLTHLYNTRFLEIVLDREIQGGNPFSVLFLDLDRFKAVNDHYGHLVGSKLLVEVGRVLKACVRDEDVVARYGGDEYVAVLIGIDSGGALKVAERIRRSIEDHVFLSREGARVRITVSIGLASYPEHTTRKSEVLELADRAMYRGKRSTRNVVYIASREPFVPSR
ncbi:MAG TPA: diguanylate cyclase [Anaeromyxobacteraceae bacterium]|nr:diguanylate cyclase [Anaeromyxobacteraceae bacterium]